MLGDWDKKVDGPKKNLQCRWHGKHSRVTHQMLYPLHPQRGPKPPLNILHHLTWHRLCNPQIPMAKGIQPTIRLKGRQNLGSKHSDRNMWPSVRLKLAFCMTYAVCVLVLAQGPSFIRLRRALLRQRGVYKVRGKVTVTLREVEQLGEEFNFYQGKAKWFRSVILVDNTCEPGSEVLLDCLRS